MIDLTDREIAAILAGLRLLQRGIDRGTLPQSIQDIWTSAGIPLTGDKIDELCERLNCGGEE